MAPSEQITVLVHGTFANPYFEEPEGSLEDGTLEEDPAFPTWWRFAEEGQEPKAADRLQEALTELDPSLEGTVWRPGDPRDKGLGYRDVGEWSGENSDKARKGAAKDLAASLAKVAEGRGCTAEEPLEVNLVAHSHGGNVVLESLKRLAPNVKPRQLCLLGTPITWRFWDPRLVYVPYLIWSFILLIWGIVDYGKLLKELPDVDQGGLWFDWLVVLVIVVPIYLWLGALLARFFRWIFGLFPGKPAYGPKPKQLEKILDGRPAQLLISPEDEADLMMHMGAAPLDVYKAMIRGRPKITGGPIGRAVRLVLRVFEIFYFRNFAYAVVVPSAEILLEHGGLGFSLPSVLLHNYEMVSWTQRRGYRNTQIETLDVEAEALKPRPLKVDLTQSTLAGTIRPKGLRETRHDKDRIATLRETLFGTLVGLRDQLKLRHSGYYESDEVLKAVSWAIAMSDEVVDVRREAESEVEESDAS